MNTGGSQITRNLPGNIWDALLGANAPSAGNVFATMADLAGAAVNIYNSDGTFGSGRAGNLTDTLNFQVSATGGISLGLTPFTTIHSLEVRAASATRHVRIVGFNTTAGVALEVRNSSSALALFNNQGLINFASFISHTVVIGVSASATAKLTVSGIGATSATINQHWRNSALATLMRLNDDGNFGIGVAPSTTERMIVRGFGTAEANAVQLWQNSTPTELMRLTGNGGLCIGINSLLGGFANAARLRVDATVSVDYTSSVVFDQTYSNTVNNTNTASTCATRLYKVSAFNTGELISSYTFTRNDGTGSINNLYGFSASTQLYGNATVGNAFAITAISSVRAGNVTTYGGIDVAWNEVGGGVIGNMIGMLVRTPVNVSGGTITNTYGIYLQPNTLGTNNYGIVSNAQSSNGFGTDTPNVTALVELASTSKGFLIMRMTAAQAGAISAVNGMGLYVTDTDATFTIVGGSFYKYQNGVWLPW